MNKFKDINLGLDMPDTEPEVQKSKSEKHRVITKDKITIQIHEKNNQYKSTCTCEKRWYCRYGYQ